MNYVLSGKIASAHPYSLDKTLTVPAAGAEAEATGKAIAKAKEEAQEYTNTHANNQDNPHRVTAKQIGLELVDNTPDLEKPVSAKQAEAIALAKQEGTLAHEAANLAHEAANNAHSTADAALPKSGGTMTGEIAMGDNKITGLGYPENDDDAVSKKYLDDYVGGKVGESASNARKAFTAMLAYNDWAGSSAPYTQTVSIEGILASDMPHVFPVYSAGISSARAEKSAWARVSDAEAEAGGIKFSCFEEKPSTSISIQIEVNR